MILVRLEGRTQREAAEALGVSQAAIAQRLATASAALGALLVRILERRELERKTAESDRMTGDQSA